MVFLIAMVTIGWLGNPRAQPSHRICLPLVQNGLPFRIYDQCGMERDWDWLVENFGSIPISAGPGLNVAVLRGMEGPNTLVADVGEAGVPVVFYWEDAPFLPTELQNCDKVRGLIVYSKENGHADFAMGGGSYYFPPAIGPHCVWMRDSGCICGLGMIGGTNHRHLDSEWE